MIRELDIGVSNLYMYMLNILDNNTVQIVSTSTKMGSKSTNICWSQPGL